MRRLIAGIALLAGVAAVAQAPQAEAAVTIHGVVRVLASDTVEHVDGSHSHEFTGPSEDVYRQVLEVNGHAYDLKGARVRPNTEVQVVGTVSGNTISATKVTKVSGAAKTTATTTTSGAAVSGITSSGTTTNVLVMLVEWATNPRDNVTPTSAATQLFGDTNGWYQDASYGALGQTGDVTPWMSIAGPTTGCWADYSSLMSQAKSAATAAGYTLANYGNYIVYFPHCSGDAAGYAGWAYVGASGTWLNGYIDRRVTVHEQGHNYGLYHSHSNLCSLGGLSGSCTFSDYGDTWDAMGSSGYVGHFNASQKTLLGWMSARTVDLSAGGSATLVPMNDDTTSTHAAVINAGNGRKYWLEFRQPQEYDSALPSTATDGVLVHVSGTGTGSGDSGASLLDVRPGDGIATTSATLKTGMSWVSPEGITISVGTVSASGAQVSVSLAPTTPTVTATNPSDGAIAVSPGVAGSLPAFTATFSENVQYVSNSTFTLSQGGSPVAATVTYDSTTRVATLVPTAPLANDTGYTLAVTSGVQGMSGVATTAKTWSFTTGPRPTVSARTPLPNATGVRRSTTVTVTFSEPVSGVSGSSFTLRNFKTGALITASVSYDSSTRTATLTPSSSLGNKVKYTVSLTSSIVDVVNNPLTALSWNFTTGTV